MTKRSVLRIGLACAVVALAASPLQATTSHIFRATFDTAFENTTPVISEPYVLIQNPMDSGGAMTVNQITLQYNDSDVISSPATGVLKHDGEDDCTVFQNAVTLQAGEGLTVSVAEALVPCLGVQCGTCATGCGTYCMKLYQFIPPNMWVCHCVPKFGYGDIISPSRVTVVVDMYDQTHHEPVVRAVDFLVSGWLTSPELESTNDVPVEVYAP